MTTKAQAFAPRVLDAAAPGFEAELDRLIAFEVAQDAEVERAVADIVADVRARGDAALLDYTRRFDRIDAASAEALEVPRADLVAAFAQMTTSERDALTTAAARIRVYHERQRTDGFSFREASGTELGQRLLRRAQNREAEAPGLLHGRQAARRLGE